MNTQIESGVKVKLFAGCLINAELKLKLNQSSLWKQAKIELSENDLKDIHYHGKDYIGQFLKNEKTSLSELKEIEGKIIHLIHKYCPEFGSEKIKIIVFSQLFIS